MVAGEKTFSLIVQARDILLSRTGGGNNDDNENNNLPADSLSIWRAYVAVEYAILDIKLRYGLEQEPAPIAPKRTAKREELFATAIDILRDIDPAEKDKKRLLYRLRECRDCLKASLAKLSTPLPSVSSSSSS